LLACLLACDAAVDNAVCKGMVKPVISFSAVHSRTQPFHTRNCQSQMAPHHCPTQITVDGDTSTNDCVIGLASGLAGNAKVADAGSEDGTKLEAALTALLQVRACVVVVCITQQERLTLSKNIRLPHFPPHLRRASPRRSRGTARAPRA
jgi:N-acetylglutamate synthase/N-acetylornithine aminotransferase